MPSRLWLYKRMSEWEYRKALKSDLPEIMEIIRQAQQFIKTQGIDQWQDGYPDEQRFLEDIGLGQCYVFYNEESIAGVMVVSFIPETCYETIEGPGWQSDADSYAVIHRMAVCSAQRGGSLAGEMAAFAQRLCEETRVPSLRVDTHRGNIPMQKFLIKNHFIFCGTVDYGWIRGDSIRLAYEKRIHIKKIPL